MREQLFSKDFHNTQLRNVEKSFSNFIDDLREDFNHGFQSDVVDENFLDHLSDILEDESFEKYSPLKFYWLNLVDNIVYLIQLHEELLIDETIGPDELLQVEEELYNFWIESELSESFQNFLENGSAVIEASNALLPLLENQIISFYVIHINKHAQTFDDAIIYQTVPEIGDSEKVIFIGDAHKTVELSTRPDTYPALPLRNINHKERIFGIEVNGKPETLEIKNSPAPIIIDGWKLYILNTNKENTPSIRSSLERALSDLQTAAPHVLASVKSFTHTIVILHEKSTPSYSLQALPGYSLLNTFEKDNWQLLEDIVAENGQHFLNSILNHQELFLNDDENCYFNPWSQEFVSVEVLFSETFKKFWSMELLYYLNMAVTQRNLSSSDKAAIRIKEQLLLNLFNIEHVRLDFDHAYKNKKINKPAQNLISNVFRRSFEIKKEVEKITNELNSLDADRFIEVMNVKAALEKNRHS